MNNSSNNKRIAKNTIVLYLRMLFTMAVSLYTTRVILAQLGVDDYGIYNVVGGLVAMFGFLSSSLSTAISRFLTFELGTGDKAKLSSVFSSSILILSALAIIIFIFVEAIGIWFLNYKMTISPDRLYAANWVLQLSSLTFVVNLLNTSYNAIVIAHERMSAFAFFAITEALLKLVICFMISWTSFDKLISYACLLAGIALVMRCLYYIYCRRQFEECKFHFVCDRSLLKNMFSFAGWNLFGSGSSLLRDQGVNILLNLFFGPMVNSARGVAVQVNSAINQLSYNFMMALNPQITKNYASNNLQYALELVFKGSKYTMYLLFLISLPLIYEAELILKLWLGNVPDHTLLFVRLILVYSMFEAVSYSMVTLMLATGKIKKYQFIVGGCQLLNFPLAFIALKLGCMPEFTIIISIFVATLCLVLRLHMLKRMVGFPVCKFVKDVLVKLVTVLFLSIPIPIFLIHYLEEGFARFFIISIVSTLITIGVIYIAGITCNERNLLKSRIVLFVNKFKNAN